MYFMNECEIDQAASQHRDHPVLGKATRFLQKFRDTIDSCSDGWAYWRLPVQAAKKLMEMINHPETATEDVFKKALVPIKSFCTRRKVAMPSIT